MWTLLKLVLLIPARPEPLGVLAMLVSHIQMLWVCHQHISTDRQPKELNNYVPSNHGQFNYRDVEYPLHGISPFSGETDDGEYPSGPAALGLRNQVRVYLHGVDMIYCTGWQLTIHVDRAPIERLLAPHHA